MDARSIERHGGCWSIERHGGCWEQLMDAPRELIGGSRELIGGSRELIGGSRELIPWSSLVLVRQAPWNNIYNNICD